MTSRFCLRCEHVLPSELDGALFCPFCGVPQVRISADLLPEIEDLRAAQRGDAETEASTGPAAARVRGAIGVAALAGAIAAALALLSLLLAPAGLLVGLWAIGAPIVMLGLYQSRHPTESLNVGFGSRLGLLTGAAVWLGLALVNTSALLITRFGLHAAAPLDAQVTEVFAQVRLATEQQYGTDAGAFTHLLAIPEFRAGLLLASLGIFTAGYLMLATLGGAFAGLLRARSART